MRVIKLLLLKVLILLFVEYSYGGILSHVDKFTSVTSLLSKFPTIVITKKDEVGQCGSNEKWNSCLPKCSITCSNANWDCLGKKSLSCQGGCECISGFIRLTETGQCVHISQCQGTNKCPVNEEWLQGSNQPDCDITCDNLRTGCTGITNSNSQGDCYCKRGYARHPTTYQCVRIDRCPGTSTTQCVANEEYRSCGNRYDERCRQDWFGGNTQNTCESGCFCIQGYARINGYCQPQSLCTVQCGPGEIREGNQCVCRNTFIRVGVRCVCPEGQVNIQGTCVLKTPCVNGTLVLYPLSCVGDACQSQACVCPTGYQLQTTSGLCTSICNVNTEYYRASPLQLPDCESTCVGTVPTCTPTTFPASKVCFCIGGYSRQGTECILSTLCT